MKKFFAIFITCELMIFPITCRASVSCYTLGDTTYCSGTDSDGENDDYLREKFCTGLEEFGIKLDREKNAAALARKGISEMEISTPDSPVKIFMIATNEELVIVEDTLAIMNGTYNPNHLEMDYSFIK